ncbi:hypothetical protein ACI65C_004384 [Semiaphis heraclei]
MTRRRRVSPLIGQTVRIRSTEPGACNFAARIFRYRVMLRAMQFSAVQIKTAGLVRFGHACHNLPVSPIRFRLRIIQCMMNKTTGTSTNPGCHSSGVRPPQYGGIETSFLIWCIHVNLLSGGVSPGSPTPSGRRRARSSVAVFVPTAISPKAIKYLSKNSSAKILDNDVFWPKVEKPLNILEPISIWIKTLESETSNLSDVVCAFHQIKDKVKNSVSVGQLSILSCIEKRRKMATEQIHLAAHLLDPRYKGKYLTKEESVDASQFIYSLAKYINLHQANVLCDLANYRTNSGLWARDFVWDCLNTKTDGNHMNIITWWNGICSSTNLATVASAILQCPPTSASTERSFSTYGLVHTAKRNRLTTERASKLVYVKHNLKLEKSNDGEDLECSENNNFKGIEDELLEDELQEEDEVQEEDELLEEDKDIDPNETESIFQAVNNKHKKY